MLTVPPIVGALPAVVCWRQNEMILGNVAGATIIFGAALALIFRESAELDALTRHCRDAGFICWPKPSAFTRYGIYAVIGLVQVVALFLASLTNWARAPKSHSRSPSRISCARSLSRVM